MSKTPARPGPSVPRAFAFPSTHAHQLSNGMRVLCAPLRRLPAATVLFAADAGAERESAEDAGVASLTAQSLSEGTATLDANALVSAFESLGGEVGSGADWTHAESGITVLVPQLDATVGLLADMVRDPRLPADGVLRLREERRNELLQQETEPRGLADDAFGVACLGRDARDGLPLGGDAAGVDRCTPERVRDFHRTHYTPAGGLLIVTGDVEPGEVFALAERNFSTWHVDRTPAEVGHAQLVSPVARVTVVDRPGAPQTELRIGHASVARNHPDFFALAIANAILGGLFNSRINMNLRETHGYTYGAFSSFDWRRRTSLWSVSTAVRSDVTVDASREVLNEIRRIRSEPVQADELSLARDYVVGVFPLRFETTAAIAGAIATREGLGLASTYYDTYRDRMAAVTAADVQRVALAHWRTDLIQIVAVGDAATIREPLEALLATP